MNVLHNAVKFSRFGGRIQVYVSIENEELQIDVIDEGVGIEEYEVKKVFKPFYKGSRQSEDNFLPEVI